MVHGIQHAAERRRRAGHLQAHVETFGHPQLGHHVIEVLFRHVHRASDAHFARQLETVLVNVSDHHVTRADVFRHRRRHHADRTGAGDQHVFPHQIEGERGVHGVAEWVEDGRQVIRDIVGNFKGVKGRDHQILGKAARAVDAHADGVAAQVGTARAAVTAVAAGDMPFAGDAVANLKAAHFLTNPHHFADIFVTDHHRHRNGLLRPLIPVVDVHVGPANGGLADFNQQIVMADFRFRYVGHPDAFFRFQFG